MIIDHNWRAIAGGRVSVTSIFIGIAQGVFSAAYGFDTVGSPIRSARVLFFSSSELVDGLYLGAD